MRSTRLTASIQKYRGGKKYYSRLKTHTEGEKLFTLSTSRRGTIVSLVKETETISKREEKHFKCMRRKKSGFLF